jgi:hypothetical protein
VDDRTSDLNPQLGWPGGVCHTVERIEEQVRNPRLREQLVDKVEDGDKLTNPEAQTIYRMEVERGTKAKLIQTLRIVPHAQYRMDQRAITVNDLRVALTEFVKAFMDAKSRNDYQFKDWEDSFNRREPIRWVSSPRSGQLVVVFAPQGNGAVNIVSTFWEGEPDPKPHACDVKRAYRTPDPQGVRTLVKNPHPEKSDTGDGHYKERALPSPQWTRSKPVDTPPRFNGPGPSGTAPGGRTVHKDMVRTKGEDGATHPSPPARTSPARRPGMEADFERMGDEEVEALLAEMFKVSGMYPPMYPTGQTRQRVQKTRAYRYFKKRYHRMRGKTLQKAKRRYRRLKNNGRFKADRKRRSKQPERFERKPSGGAMSVADRSKKYREKQKRKAAPILSPIPFVYMPTDEEGQVRSVSVDGVVNFTLKGRFEQLPFDVFMDRAFIYDEDDLEDFFDYLDGLIGFDLEGAMDDLENEDEEDDEDPVFDVWNEGLSKQAFQVKFRARPKVRQRRQRGQDKQKAKLRYRRNRQRNKMRSKIRHKRLKNNPTFKRQQKHYRRNRGLFKRRHAEVLTVPEIAFVIGRALNVGVVHSISPMTGLVTFHRRFEDTVTDRFESMPVARFLYSVVFLTEEDADAFFDLVDTELGDDAYDDVDAEGLKGGAELMGVDCDDPEWQAECDRLVGHHDLDSMTPNELDQVDSALITRFTYGGFEDPPHEEDEEPNPADPYLIDPTDDDYIYGKVWLREEYEAAIDRVAFLYEKRPPQMDPETVYDRAQDRKLKPKPKKKRPSEAPGGGAVDRANPGSRVLPGEGGHVDMGKWKVGGFEGDKIGESLDRLMHRQAARISEIRDGCGPDLVKRALNLKIKLKRADPRNAMWHFSVPGSKGDYLVKMKALRSGNVRDLGKVHVKVSCSCPFWQWQGPEHWAKTGDYLYGKPRGTASKPDGKDPSGQHKACKHVLACFNWVTTHQWRVPENRGRTAGLRYLADSLTGVEVIAVFDDVSSSVDRVAARYLQGRRSPHA